MGWERRGNRVYFYTAERVGGRVVKRYVGGGPHAAAVARLAAAERGRRAAGHEAARVDRAAVAARDAALDGLAEMVAEAALLAAGFRQHHRGEWRKRREERDPAD